MTETSSAASHRADREDADDCEAVPLRILQYQPDGIGPQQCEILQVSAKISFDVKHLYAQVT
jgi:hypothetical protein